MKNTLRIIFGIAILASAFSFVACKEEVDNDVITGKWIDDEILYTPDSLIDDCKKKSYLEFSEYKIDLDKRTVNQYYACDYYLNENGDTVDQVPYSELVGYYTITLDTLKILYVKDYTTKVFSIKDINAGHMKLNTLNNDGEVISLYYSRFKE